MVWASLGGPFLCSPQCVGDLADELLIDDPVTASAPLLKKFDSRTAIGGVVGLGYVGLPLIVEMARSGYASIGLDVSERVVAGINAGTSHIQDIPTDQLAPLVKEGKVRATTKAA